MKRLVTALCTVAVASGLVAQKASYGYFGTGCNATLRALSLPKLGSTLRVEVDSQNSSGFWSRHTLLLSGFSTRRYGALRLPFDTKILSGRNSRMIWSWCGSLRTSIALVQPAPRAARTSIVTIPIPNDQRLLGVVLYQQALVLEQQFRNPLILSYSLSRGGQAVLGH